MVGHADRVWVPGQPGLRRAGRDRLGSRHLGSFDPLLWMVGAGAVLTYALHGFSGMLSRDLGMYSYAGQQVADGVPPYLGVLNRAGPLAHLLPAVGALVARLGGLDDLVAMRLWFM